MFFCLRQQKFCDTAASTERLRLPRIWWAVTFCLLPATKSQIQWVFACHREVGELHALKPFFFRGNWRGAFPRRDPYACSAGENDKPVPEEEVQKQCPSLSWGLHQQRIIYCCRSFKAGSGRELFLPRDNNRGWWPFRFFFSSASSWTAWLHVGGRKGLPLKLVKLSFNLSWLTSAN